MTERVIEARLATVVRMLAGSPAASRAFALAYFVLVAWLALTQRYLHDEAVFTLDAARAGQHAPLALFFFQKSKPALMVLYVLPAALGVRAYVMVHATLGALAVYLVSEAARRLGFSSPNVAGWALAGSLSFTIAASNGYPNSDGAFFAALFLYLYASERRTAAAVVLGMLFFVRNELAALTLVFGAWDLYARRDLRFLAAILAVPALYGLAGALYHRDALWLYNDFPNPAGLPPEIRTWRAPTPLEALHNLRDGLLSNAPVLAVFGLAAAGARDRRLVPLLASVVAVYGVMTALQVADLLGFDSSPRYYVAALPVLAVLASAALSSDGRAPWIAAGVLSLLCASVLPAGAAVAAVVVAAVVLVLLRRRELALALLGSASVALLGWQLTDDTVRERTQHLGYHELVAEMRARGLYQSGRPLYVDLPIARYDLHVPIDEVYMLANAAIAWETERYLDPRNGQRQQLMGAVAHAGLLFHPEEHEPRRDATYALRDDARTRQWREHLEAAGAVGTRVGRHWVYTFPASDQP
ncbi:hypothetical protein [Sandaracinus amylolyticus]|uniref:hypothetical protein n=1 Tax=Sandaracinus amylolyticus TaxID=927083 RepID=UPI001F189B6A|nr:hypothetical protein [Sandaracinus amylolyticus]UJR84381.1 Hypothetical protein I5071_64600 [Sandaracinus amylolyticus]